MSSKYKIPFLIRKAKKKNSDLRKMVSLHRKAEKADKENLEFMIRQYCVKSN
jgi:hypothetical protein